MGGAGRSWIARSYLFAPGNNERLLRKVFTAGADAVVLDLEDAVPPDEKEVGRRAVARTLDDLPVEGAPPVWVRINGAPGELWRPDLEAVVCPQLTGVRLPKAESVEAVRIVEEAISEAEERAGLEPGRVALTLTIESALGVLEARSLAECRRVGNFTLGAADFISDIGANPDAQERATLFACSQLVLCSRAAGIDPPTAPAYTRLDDLEGLRASSRSHRDLGFFGRSALHPKQLPVIHEVFTPRAEEVAEAREIVAAFEAAQERASGVVKMASGQFVDLAVVRRARAVVDLADALLERESAQGR